MSSSTRLPLSSLIELCRALRHSLGAGLSLVDAFRHQARRGPRPLRPVAEEMRRDLERGDSLEDVLHRHEDAFPPLFLALAGVGEQTGTLPVVFGELERYFTLQRRLRRQFLTQCIRPVFQFVVSVVIIALLIWILGIIAEGQGVPPLDPLGLGLTGARGAVVFLFFVGGALGALAAGYLLATRVLGRRAGVEALLLRLPAIGPCLRAFALARFCLALRLTFDSGTPIVAALALSLCATGSHTFAACVPRVRKQLEAGRDLTSTLVATELFPDDLNKVMGVAEETGQIADVMRREAEHYQAEAERRLTFLTRAASFLLWALVAALIATAIVRIFLNTYLAATNF